MNAHTLPKMPIMRAAAAVSPPSNSFTSLGSTGAIIPRAKMASMTVMRMNATAAGRAPGVGGEDLTRRSYRPLTHGLTWCASSRRTSCRVVVHSPAAHFAVTSAHGYLRPHGDRHRRVGARHGRVPRSHAARRQRRERVRVHTAVHGPRGALSTVQRRGLGRPWLPVRPVRAPGTRHGRGDSAV